MEELRYRAEEAKSIIYDTETDKDVCMYFDEEMKNLLLELLNKPTN